MVEVNFDITPKEFVNEFKNLKDSLVQDYFSKTSEISRLDIMVKQGFNSEQIELVKSIFDDGLTDGLYNILLSLEGCSAIHKHQITYKLQDEEGNELTGELDSLAYEAFHETKT